MQHVGSTSLTRDRTPGPLHWEHGALATGPPGKSPKFKFLKSEFIWQKRLNRWSGWPAGVTGFTQVVPKWPREVSWMMRDAAAPSPTWEGRKDHHARSSMWSGHRMMANNSQKSLRAWVPTTANEGEGNRSPEALRVWGPTGVSREPALGSMALYSQPRIISATRHLMRIQTVSCHRTFSFPRWPNKEHFASSNVTKASLVALLVRNPPANVGAARDMGSIPGSGRSPGEWNGNPVQYSCMRNPTDRGTWWATVHGASKGQTRLSSWTSTRMWLTRTVNYMFYLYHLADRHGWDSFVKQGAAFTFSLEVKQHSCNFYNALLSVSFDISNFPFWYMVRLYFLASSELGDDLLHSIDNRWGFPGGSVGKNLPASAGDAGVSGSIPGSGRSPGGGNGNPLQ